MNSKLDEIGLALGNARVELNNLIVEYSRVSDTLNIDDDNRFLTSIGRASILVHELEDKWDNAEHDEFICAQNEQRFEEEYLKRKELER